MCKTQPLLPSITHKIPYNLLGHSPSVSSHLPGFVGPLQTPEETWLRTDTLADREEKRKRHKRQDTIGKKEGKRKKLAFQMVTVRDTQVQTNRSREIVESCHEVEVMKVLCFCSWTSYNFFPEVMTQQSN